MLCWKCQAETGGEAAPECERCLGEGLSFQERKEPTFVLDFDAMPEADLKAALRSLKLRVFLTEASEHFRQLREWLRPE